MPSAYSQVKYVIVVIDYFTKWVNVEPLTALTKAKISNFIWHNIICRSGILYGLVTDNGKQFDNEKYQKICLKLRIRCCFSSPIHSHANG